MAARPTEIRGDMGLLEACGPVGEVSETHSKERCGVRRVLP